MSCLWKAEQDKEMNYSMPRQDGGGSIFFRFFYGANLFLVHTIAVVSFITFLLFLILLAENGRWYGKVLQMASTARAEKCIS